MPKFYQSKLNELHTFGVIKKSKWFGDRLKIYWVIHDIVYIV